METILNHINTFKYIYLAILLLILVILIIILIKKREPKVKPIELEEVFKEQPKSDLEDVIAALESNQNERPMTTFEQEQEENAIISYQELVAAVQDKKAKMQVTEQTKQNEEELKPLENQPEEIIVEEQPVRKFKNSEFISPVFGKDTKTNDDFLKELKDFRRSL